MYKAKRLRISLGTAVLAAVVAVLATAASASAGPPFTQCPAIGADPSCHTLIIVNAKGEFEAENDPTVGPYDGIEDTLLGVENRSTGTVKTIPIEGTFIFGFDGDGICSGSFTGTPAGCPFGPTGYEGPNTEFTVIDTNHGSVNFPAGLEPGATTYFSLEEPINLECGPEKCKQVEPCKEAQGVGHAGPIGPEGLNENNKLNISLAPKQEFEVTAPNGEGHFRLVAETSASCKEIAGGHVYSATGTGRWNRLNGYSAAFSWEVVGKEIFFSVTVEKNGGGVVFSVTHVLLNKGSKEKIK